MQVQILSQEYPPDHPWLPGWQNVFKKINVLEEWQSVQPDMPVIAGSNLRGWNVRHWLNRRQPALYIGRGYVGNHLYKQRKFWRVSVNGWANICLMPVPHSRWPMMNLPKHPWKVQQVKNVLIAPSKMTTLSWSQMSAEQWAESMVAQFPGANIRIRLKASKPWQRWETLWSDLDWADLVVAQSSAITCEAFWYGKKVISTKPCPTWACGQQWLEDWQNPDEPALREAWHEHLAWSQYTNEEWQSGEAFRFIDQYLGPVIDYDPGHVYNFTAIED